MTPLSIGILTWAYPPEKSGLSRAAREISEALSEAGHNVRVITLDRHGSSDQCGVQIVGAAELVRPLSPLGIARRLPVLGHFSAPAAFHKAVLRQHARRPFDIVEGTNWYAPGHAVTRYSGIPYVTRHSTPAATSIEQRPTLRNRIDAAMARRIERLSAQRSRGHISNTVPHGEKIAQLYSIDPPGAGHAVVGLSLSADIRRAGEVSFYQAAACGAVQLLFIGRAEARKGIDILLGAIDILVAETESGLLPDFHLTCVGLLPEDIANVADRVRCRLTIQHRVEERDLLDMLATAHVVAAPSRYESFGLVYQEALAFGRPVAALAADPSARQFLGDTGAGLLACHPSAESYAATLRELILCADLRQRTSDRARRAAGRFTRSSLAQDTLSLYRTVLNMPENG